MSISFVAALAGTVLAAAGTGLAIRLCARRPRADMVAWVMALAGLTVGLAAQAAGYRRGFVPTTFRATQLGAALIAPLSLAWGMAELAAKGLVARFAARLGLAGLFVVAAVILATDVLSAQPFSQRWPPARDHFEFLPLGLLALVAVAVVLTVVVALSATGLRSRGDPAWRPALAAVGLASVAALATQALQVALPADTAYPAVTAIAAVAAWLAARQAARVSVARAVPPVPGPAGRAPGAVAPATPVMTRWTCTATVTAASRTARRSPPTPTAGTARPPVTRARPTAARAAAARTGSRISTAGNTTTRAASRWAATRVPGASRCAAPRTCPPTRWSRSPAPSTPSSGRTGPRGPCVIWRRVTWPPATAPASRGRTSSSPPGCSCPSSAT
jgi:hypothetical protein